LGLAISAQLVQLKGGRIWVESQLGQGSTFHFTAKFEVSQQPSVQSEEPVNLEKLPVRSIITGHIANQTGDKAERPEPVAQAALLEGRTLHILLAEDNEVNTRLAVRLLEKRGHRVVTTSDGREAVVAYEQQPFDVILMDVQMPQMNGFEATAAIREKEQRTHRRTPIIAMTARAIKGDREECLAAGMDGYVSKPVQARELLEVIDRLVRNGNGVRQERQMKSEMPQIESKAVVNREVLLASVEEDLDFLREVIELFLEDYPGRLTGIREAVWGKEGEKLERAAHGLKGGLGSLHAEAAQAAALQLEQMGRTGELAEADKALAVLEQELDRLRPALLQLATEPMDHRQ
jgi:two-component system sensor histidine kinase/response regulator